MLKTLTNREFRLLWLGQAVSHLGDQFHLIALPWLVLALTGDPLLFRRDGLYAYHLAVGVDDAAQGVTEVVRGADLRAVTATQIRLQEALGLPRPAYAHLGLVTSPDGSRLGKREGALGRAELQAKGIGPAALLGWLGWSLGCLDRPLDCRAEDLVPAFAWSRVPPGPVAVPQDWAEG